MNTITTEKPFYKSASPFIVGVVENPHLTEIADALFSSYETDGGINHLDGTNLPSAESVDWLASDFMHLLFPGFFEQCHLPQKEVLDSLRKRLADVETRLTEEIRKSLHFARETNATAKAHDLSRAALRTLPHLRKTIQTDVMAAYHGDPAARSIEEIILSYPCVLVVSLQRIAHVLYKLGVPLIPRMLTEYAHERTGCDIHPGAQIGTHFFVDHCTGVVIGETARIGNHVKLYQGVTLGAKSFVTDANGNPTKGVKRHPEIEDHVTIYAHATILGGDTKVGAHTVVGANVWLLQSVPENSIVYYSGEGLTVRRRRSGSAPTGAPSPEVLIELDWEI